MKKIISILILIFIITIGCSEKNKKITDKQKENLTELKNRVSKTGDKDAFIDLILKTGNSKYPYEILPYALIMANKYNNGEGCYQVLRGIISLNNPKMLDYNLSIINNFSEEDKQFVISYLTKGAKLKNVNCILALEEMYKNGWGVNKNLEEANKFLNEYDTLSNK